MKKKNGILWQKKSGVNFKYSPFMCSHWRLVGVKCLLSASHELLWHEGVKFLLLILVMWFSHWQDYCGDYWLCGPAGNGDRQKGRIHRLSQRVNSQRDSIYFVCLSHRASYRSLQIIDKESQSLFSLQQTANTVFSQSKPLLEVVGRRAGADTSVTLYIKSVKHFLGGTINKA